MEKQQTNYINNLTKFCKNPYSWRIIFASLSIFITIFTYPQNCLFNFFIITICYLAILKLVLLINKIENFANLLYAKPTIGFLTKYIVVLGINTVLSIVYCVFYEFSLLKIILITNISSTMLYFALNLSYFNIGNRNNNMDITLSATLLLFNLHASKILIPTFLQLIISFLLFIYVIGKLLLSEYRSIAAPRQGIGIFFGSFNPVHKTHIKMIQNAIKSRNLEKVLIQVNTVPKLHRVSLQNKEIISENNGKGFNIYKKTKLAIPGKNYFPTGNKFIDHSIRVKLLKKALDEYGLAEKVQILNYGKIYDQSGFPAIIKKIQHLNKDTPLHGIHGSDVGGMWVRYIFNHFSFLYPYPVIRNDDVSSTRIRGGEKNLTTDYVQSQIDKIIP